MVSIPVWDEQLKKVARFGRSGNLSQQAPAQRKFDDLSREVAALRDSIELIIRHLRQGPDWENQFDVAYSDADSDGVVRVAHNLGYTTGDWIITRFASELSSPAGAGVDYWPALRMLDSNDRETRFQFAAKALSGFAECRYRVVPCRPGLIPVGAVSESYRGDG